MLSLIVQMKHMYNQDGLHKFSTIPRVGHLVHFKNDVQSNIGRIKFI